MSTISDLQRALGEVLKVSRFEITIPSPGDLGASPINKVLTRSASFPSKTIGTVEIYRQGRKVNLPGDVEFENTWELKFYEKTNGEIRRYFSDWMNYISEYQFKHGKHIKEYVTSTLTVQSLNATRVEEIDEKGVIRMVAGPLEEGIKYKFHNAYPSNLGSVEFSSESINQIAEFGVTFQFDYWEELPV